MHYYIGYLDATTLQSLLGNFLSTRLFVLPLIVTPLSYGEILCPLLILYQVLQP